MKKIILIIILLISGKLHAQKCSCTSYPWTPDSCYKRCAPIVLNKSTKAELVMILGISSSVADKILSEKSKSSLDTPKSLESYLGKLNESDSMEVSTALKSLNIEKVTYFNKPAKDRERKKVAEKLDAILKD